MTGSVLCPEMGDLLLSLGLLWGQDLPRVLRVKRGWAGSLCPLEGDGGWTCSLIPQTLEIRTSHTHPPTFPTLKLKRTNKEHLTQPGVS